MSAIPLTAEPEERRLNMGRVIVAFNIKLSAKTIHLNTGNKFNYNRETYEVMNRETIDSPDNYVKFNCLRKASALPGQSKTGEQK